MYGNDRPLSAKADTRYSVRCMAHPDLNQLLNSVLDFAHKMLKEHGEFYPFGHSLDDIVKGESIKGHTLLVRRITQAPAPQSCHVVFVEEPAKENAKILHELGPGVLTVGEGEDFLRDGGMITFVVLNRRVRFDVHPSVAETVGLKLSSQLLSVARAVEK